MKFTLHLQQKTPFASNVPIIELEGDRIACNDITFDGEPNYHNTRLWVIGNEYGALGAVWADHEQDAFDALVDANLGQAFLIEQGDYDELSEEEQEDLTHLGNAGEPADLQHAWIAPVEFKPERDIKLMLAFAEARGASYNDLSRF